MTYGKNARVGNLPVFSKEGAIRAYKIFAKAFSDNLTMEASVILSDASDDMHKLGFTWDEIEALEVETV